MQCVIEGAVENISVKNIENFAQLTHSNLMEFPTDTNWTRPFLFKGFYGDIFFFIRNFIECVETLIRRHADLGLQCLTLSMSYKKDARLIWVKE